MTLEIITSDAIAARHGFFTRKGGISSGIFAGLNCGPGSSDQDEVVQLNRHLVAESLGVADKNLLTVHQVHSAEVITVASPFSADHPKPKGDALVTSQKGLALGILTADCAPILFEDSKAGVIGAAHAGWQGALGGVIATVITAMEALGADRQSIHASIGPCISQKAYEVGQEFLEEFIALDMQFTSFFAQGEGDRYQFDLPRFCLHKLRQEQIGQANWTSHCTYSEENRFYSYRRTTHRGEPDYGRQISAIVLD
ncbi:MAG: peptidoglycan editing factor PgeF [Rhodobacteraceae bacterium]|nr:peptidoglycan editing factor PgeF [Paracoccaceae bacterium]